MNDAEIALRWAEMRLECLRIANSTWAGLLPDELTSIAVDLMAFVADDPLSGNDEPLPDERVREIMAGIRKRADGAA